MMSSLFLFVCFFCVLISCSEGSPKFTEFSTNRLIVDVGVEGAGHHLIGHFLHNLYSCSIFFGEEKDKQSQRKRLEETKLHWASKDVTGQPHQGPHSNFNPLYMNAEDILPLRMKSETVSTLKSLQNSEQYKNGVTVFQTLCSWPCGGSKMYHGSLSVMQQAVQEVNAKNPPKDWELGVIILIRDPKETILSHSREYIVNPLIQTAFSWVGYDETHKQLLDAQKKLGEKFRGFAFSANLVTNLYRILHPKSLQSTKAAFSSFANTTADKRFHKNSFFYGATKCIAELSSFFRENTQTLSCAVEKTGRALSERHSYGIGQKFPAHFEGYYDMLFKDAKQYWPEYHACFTGSSDCAIPSPCLPFLN